MYVLTCVCVCACVHTKQSFIRTYASLHMCIYMYTRVENVDKGMRTMQYFAWTLTHRSVSCDMDIQVQAYRTHKYRRVEREIGSVVVVDKHRSVRARL